MQHAVGIFMYLGHLAGLDVKLRNLTFSLLDYNILFIVLEKCSKDATGGTAGDGNGSGKGNCPIDGQICYAAGCSGMYLILRNISTLLVNIKLRNLAFSLFDYNILFNVLEKCSKDATGGTAGDGNGSGKGNCPIDGQICYAAGCSGMYLILRNISTLLVNKNTYSLQYYLMYCQ